MRYISIVLIIYIFSTSILYGYYMNIYKLIKLDPLTIKGHIKNENRLNHRLKLWTALLLRSILIVLAATIFIIGISSIFGKDNTAFAIVLFCLLFSLRYVPLGYSIGQEIIALSIVFFILTFSTSLASQLQNIYSLPIHFLSMWILLGVSCLSYPKVHGALIAFSYIYLAGNPVNSESLVNRALVATCGLGLAIVFYLVFHSQKVSKNNLKVLIKYTTLVKNQIDWEIWRLRLTIAISTIIYLGSVYNWPRFIWAAFACSSMLAPYDIKHPAWQRLLYRFIGVVEGALLFYFLQSILPDSVHFILGAIGGVCLGMCTHYRRQTLFNTVGALLAASQIYPVTGALQLRIINTIIGLCVAVIILLVEEMIRSTYRSKHSRS